MVLPFSCDGIADAVAKPHTAIELEMGHGTDYPGHFTTPGIPQSSKRTETSRKSGTIIEERGRCSFF